jgi:RNA polymerase sigma factor (sigma-70 family)
LLSGPSPLAVLPHEMTDADLVEACGRGDRAAFATLISRHARMVAAVAFASAGQAALVDDVVQDTFVAAWQRLGSLRDAASVRPWLRRIAANLGRKARRSRAREVAEVDIAGDVTPFDTAVARQNERMIEVALARLGPRYREPLVLFYYEQQSIRDVASALHLNEATVMQRLSRARKQLGDALDADVRSELSRRHGAPAAGIALAVLALIGRAEPASAALLIVRATWSRFAGVGAIAAAIGLLASASTGARPSPSELESHAATRTSPPPPTVASAVHDRAPPQLPPQPTIAIEGVPHGGKDPGSSWATQVIRNVVVAGLDPVETCRRGVRGLAIAALSPPDGHANRLPSERIRDRAEELAEQVATSCEGDAWPALWAICEASPTDVLDGNVNCYPYDELD